MRHGLSQQGVWVLFWTPEPLKRTPQDTQKILRGISKYLNLKLIIGFFNLLIIPMTLFNDIMPYFDEFIYVYGWNMSILWSPLKIWTPKSFTTANFRHPISKSWLRHCCGVTLLFQQKIIITPMKNEINCRKLSLKLVDVKLLFRSTKKAKCNLLAFRLLISVNINYLNLQHMDAP